MTIAAKWSVEINFYHDYSVALTWFQITISWSGDLHSGIKVEQFTTVNLQVMQFIHLIYE